MIFLTLLHQKFSKKNCIFSNLNVCLMDGRTDRPSYRTGNNLLLFIHFLSLLPCPPFCTQISRDGSFSISSSHPDAKFLHPETSSTTTTTTSPRPTTTLPRIWLPLPPPRRRLQQRLQQRPEPFRMPLRRPLQLRY